MHCFPIYEEFVARLLVIHVLHQIRRRIEDANGQQRMRGAYCGVGLHS